MLRYAITILLGGAWATTGFGQPAVHVVGTTSTQAVLSYMAPDTAACTVVVSEDMSLSPLVHDVNPNLFSNADQDLSRSTTVVNGRYRTLTIGVRTSEKAANGWLYSRALQTFTPHYYSISCSSGTATGTFVTTNIPLGNTFPEVPPFNSDGFGNYAWPTINWTDATKTYIDPMTGVLLKLAYQTPGRSTNSTWGGNVEYAFSAYRDINGAWTNTSNALNKTTSGPFASYSGTANDPLYLAMGYDGPFYLSGWSTKNNESLDDVRLTLYGYGSDATAANRTMLACLSIDSGASCASAEIEMTLPQATAAAVTGPSTYPTVQFGGWSPERFLRRNETSAPHGTVNVSGTTVTVADTSYSYNYFNTSWAAGDKIHIAGSSSACTNNLCTIASVHSATSLTINESPGTLTGAAYQGAAWGIRLRKKSTTGTVYLNSSWTDAYSFSPVMPANGVADFCSKQTTTVSYAADGVTAITPVQGRLCILQSTSYASESMLVLLIESTGETRILSDFNSVSGPRSVPYGSFDPTDALSLYVNYTDYLITPKHHLYKITYNATSGKFKAFTGSNYDYNTRPSDYLVWTDLMSTSSVEDLIAASITSNPFYKSSMGSSASFVGIVGNYALYSLSFGGGQNTPGFIIRFDLSGNLAQIVDTMGGTSSTGRWGGIHTVQTFGAGDWTMVSINPLNVQSSSSYMGGPFALRGISAVYKSDAWNTSDTSISPSDMYTCTVGNAYESQGATGAHCLKIRITGEPCSAYATTAEKTDYPCPWDSSRSMPQTLQPGDALWATTPAGYQDGSYEKMLIISKTDLGSGAFELEVMRAAICSTYNDTLLTHATGWGATMNGTNICGGNGWWINAKSPTWYAENDVMTSGHGTLGSGTTSDTYTMLVAGMSSRFSQPIPDQFGKAAMYSQQVWSSNFGGVSRQAGSDVQSYPNKGQWTASAAEQVWALDLRHYNPSYGSGSETPATIWTQSYSLVSGTTQVYKIDNNGVYGKVLPYLSWAGPHLLKDMSGPTSVITDADSWRFCVALRAGECRAGSAINDTFVNVPSASISTSCITNQHSGNYPCFTNGYWFGAWATQSDVSRDDKLGKNSRRLTMALTGPGRQYQFKNVHTTPSGQWAFAESGWLDGVRDDMLLMKLPPWPNTTEDGTRDGFVPIRVDLGPNGQYTKARVRFGYTENGAVSDFFCTSRQEACVTDSALTPFAYAQSETLTPVACQSGCSISIPAIPGRVLYYQVERLNDSGTDVLKQAPEIKVVP